ncbi:Tyrosyl-DNA phosphodiesterase [Necator americanus]|uniref:Tyrosyl-DNA phosphodiesterase n=1 Tax=Necator americanus TaxID=51031 RepID=W2SMW4_NECAM|nr:Tyrosyl-DNA phosphodiesterase [Necator americanus]ETN70848.1 Tyrosyl-DNA phosphodiesterase [Necator americanus]
MFSDTTENEFANDLCDYLAEYHLPDITYWIDRIRNSEFTGISDRLLFSVPGYHKSSRISKFGHPSLLRLLGDRPTPKEDARRLFLAQCSSIGSLGDKREAWLLPQFLHSLQGGKSLVFSRLFLIYPCVEDVRHSLEGYSAGDSLPYQESTSKRQPWLREIMCKWRSEGKGRTKAMPHVKKNKTQLMVRSYELGVLIMDPERIKLPYDYPVVKYSQKDDPWICDMSYTEADSHGRQWIVSRR